ncbi:hypothetical protein FCOIX_13234 [Fusarium coicis]|nr:hypothetical protein FCOIX_13234 [Fusarium coicis]
MLSALETVHWVKVQTFQSALCAVGDGFVFDDPARCLGSLRSGDPHSHHLNRGARAALLQNSPVVVNGTIGISPAPGRMAQTPSSPLNAAATTTTATEGAERASPVSTLEQRPTSIVESANNLAREHAEEYNTKLMVFRAFCTKFEEATQQFATEPQRRFAQQFANDFLGFWKRKDSCSGPVAPKPTYSSVAAAALPTDHDPVETNKEWFTYVVSDVPARLTDFYGNEVDSDSVVSDEIEIQTGLKPIDVRTGRQFSDDPLTKALLVSFLKPTKRFWSLFGSSAARLVDKTDRPRQCEKCWGHHFARNCHRQPVCRRCGEAGHLVDDCIAREQCVNCLGPHQANFHSMSGPLVRRHTDNGTKNHSRDRIRKPIRARLSDKTRMPYHKNDRTLVLQAQLYQEHLGASWWPRPLMLAMKQRKNPNSPDQAHRESAE